MISRRSTSNRRSKAARSKAYRGMRNFREQSWLPLLKMLGGGSVLAVALLTIITTAHYVYRYLDASVAEIGVEGEIRHVARKHIEDLVNGYLDGGFLSLDMVLLCEEIESHPWIANVSARRVWPDNLVLHIEEEVPVARWGEARFVNERGEILPETAASDPGALPRLNGPVGQHRAVMAAYSLFSKQLETTDLELRQLAMDSRGGWILQFDNDVELVLGEKELDVRFHRFLGLWQKELIARSEDLVRVDARYGNGLAVQWRSGDVGKHNKTGGAG